LTPEGQWRRKREAHYVSLPAFIRCAGIVHNFASGSVAPRTSPELPRLHKKIDQPFHFIFISVSFAVFSTIERGMDQKNYEEWLDTTIPKQNRLTTAVTSIVKNLLEANEIDFLTVTGRTKTKASALEKIQRKGYRNPATQMTDLSGIRIVVFLESDVNDVLSMIHKAFRVDEKNSLNKDDVMPADQIGYRSVHVVCDLGDGRCALPEFAGLDGLKFEFQLRTVMQHAWAELAHDRNYKFSGKLPRAIERKMYLYAGMLEVADKGFDELAKEIDNYIKLVRTKSDEGDLSSDINSLSLRAFIASWAKKNDLQVDTLDDRKDDLSDLISELSKFGIRTLADLNVIMTKEYIKICKVYIDEPTIFGVVRDCMLIKDWRRFAREVQYDWVLPPEDMAIFEAALDADEFQDFRSQFEWGHDPTDEEYQ
jgi:putative GTP pyrophosphokinase